MSASIESYVYSIDPIGRGSFSTVYKGFDTKRDQIIAIKQIDLEAFPKDDLKQRLIAEVRLLTQLEHRNIVRFIDFLASSSILAQYQIDGNVIDSDRYCYIVLEYGRDGDLSTLLKHKRRFTEDEARNYTQQIATGLEYLQLHNIVHRDLKPQNILVDGDRLMITDFNFARKMLEMDMCQTLCGSPLYMAPEILNSQPYTNKSDLWSVGIIVYQMVYGRTPYHTATNIMDLVRKIKSQTVYYSSDVSKELNDLLRKLLRRTPDYRIGWHEFFEHPWIRGSTYSDDDDEEYERSIFERSAPINIQPRIIEDYDRTCVASSAPAPKPRESVTGTPRTDSVLNRTPKRNTSSDLWGYMNSSMSLIRSALKYAPSTDF